MMRILLDADASIKLTKIGIIETFASCFEVILTSEVYGEHVIAGLKRNYPDALEMEKLVSGGKVLISSATGDNSLVDDFRLGRGEKSVIDYYHRDGAIDLIISDDAAFLKVLDRFEVPFSPVAGVILMCIIHGLIGKEKGLAYLELLKPMIKDEHVFYIRSKIEGLL